MIDYELIALLKRRYEQSRKAYGTALFELYRYAKIHEECGVGEVLIEDVQDNPECFDGGVCGTAPVDDLIIAYLLMLQAERDERAGHAVEGRTLNKLIAAFEEWIEKDWQEIKEVGEP
jgi:hypothetical protein